MASQGKVTCQTRYDVITCVFHNRYKSLLEMYISIHDVTVLWLRFGFHKNNLRLGLGQAFRVEIH